MTCLKYEYRHRVIDIHSRATKMSGSVVEAQKAKRIKSLTAMTRIRKIWDACDRMIEAVPSCECDACVMSRVMEEIER